MIELSEVEKSTKEIEGSIADVKLKSAAVMSTLRWPKDEGEREAQAQNYQEADRLVSLLHAAWSKGEKERLKLTAPLNEVLKQINGRFKTMLDPVKNLKESLKLKMGEYAREELFWKRAEEDKIRKAEIKRLEDEQIAKAEQAEKMGLNKTADTIISEEIKKPKVFVPTATNEAKAATVTRWRGRIADKSALLKAEAEGKLSPGIVVINTAEIDRQAQASKGMAKIPGVELYEDVQVRAR